MTIINLTLQEFIEKNPLSDFRIVKLNGISKIITSDYKVDRFNLEISNGVIVNYHMG